VNRQLNRLAVVAIFLLVACVVATTYWQTWASAGLAERQDNAIQRVAQLRIKRGVISGPAGTLLFAANRRERAKGQTLYLRRYPTRGLAAQTVGYSTPGLAQAGIEREENSILTGSTEQLNTFVDKLKGATVEGDSLALTVSARAQRIALDGLAGRCGAVVALDPRTGKVLVIASSPTFDPNRIDEPSYLARLDRPNPNCGGAQPSPLLNRPAAGLFTPGSTFKMVTAAAALDTGAFTPDSQFDDPGYCIEYGQKVRNAGNPEAPETFGHVNLVQGFQHSINSVFCNIGKAIGAGTILEYAKRFGFYSLPPLETPASERKASGLYDRRGRLYDPQRPATQVDPGRLAFGQERLLATPLQMAMVAGAIANQGVVMRPYVIGRVLDPKGKTVDRTKPEEIRRAIKPETATELTAMMVAAVQGGTGTAAQIPGIQVAGKTGTAETGIAGTNTTWFVCFAPADHPKVVVAAVLERQHGFGGTIAAPIAKQVLEALLPRSGT
jgi:peptidoglycan glycosyltransferase